MSFIYERYARRWAILFAAFIFSSALSAQAPSASITGTVRDASGEPVAGAVVTLIELHRRSTSGADGRFVFNGIPPAHYHLRAESRHHGIATGEADLSGGVSRDVEIAINPTIHAEEIVVTGSGDSRMASEVYQPIDVLSEDELTARLQSTLGETLNEMPGVTSTSFGAGSSRPVIRGLGADRIRILEDGVGTGDVSNISPDHAVTVDPAAAEQIEIVRGPATLLYGSNAIGGAVNVITQRIPNRVPTAPATGTLSLRYGSGSEEKTSILALEGGASPLAWQANVTLRDTNDYEIPAPADAFDDPAEFGGKLDNSALGLRSGTAGLSWVGKRGFIGSSFTSFETNYGVPGHGHNEEEEGEPHEEAEGVRVDMTQRRFDVRGEVLQAGSFFSNVRLRLGATDYEHRELEGDVIGTQFSNDSWEGRLEARHRPLGRVSGTWGIQLSSGEFSAAGEEAYIPANESATQAVFAFEEVKGNRLDVQFGARFERQDVRTTEGVHPERDFDGLSGSLGALYKPRDGYVVALSLARAVRLPTPTELYASGPHAATAQFEVGNPMLATETSTGIDVSLRRTAGRLQGELNLFSTRFDGFIFESPTGAVEDGFGVYEFLQRDAHFRGAEFAIHSHVWARDDAHVEFNVDGDYVRATLRGGDDLPRIAPMRLGTGLRLHGGPWSASAEIRRVFEQDRVAEGEEPTGGYTMVNAYVGYRFLLQRRCTS
ncbi:MAG: TonB-dependent receptor [Thermoanaerobaculia bacterium]